MIIDPGYIAIGITIGAAIAALWYILRDNETWEPPAIKVEKEDRRRTENQAYREMVERATKKIPVFRCQAEILDDDRHRDPRSIV